MDIYPKNIMFGQLRDGNHPRLCYKDVKGNIKSTDTNFETLESIADEKSTRKTLCHEGVRKAEEYRFKYL